jgi:hypothetical protein
LDDLFSKEIGSILKKSKQDINPVQLLVVYIRLLLHLLQKHGYKAKIDLKEAKKILNDNKK